jgi:hypothetical protein
VPKIRALTEWSGRKAGEVWDATDDDARLLCASDLPGGQKAEYVDRVMRAVDSPLVQSQPQQPSEKRRYMRRDMQAQN